MVSKESFIAVNRYGLGSHYTEIQKASKNPKLWLRQQATPATARSELKTYSGDMASTNAILSDFAGLKKQGSERKDLLKQGRKLFQKEMEQRTYHSFTTQNPFAERLALFWSNHFTISIKGKPHIAAIAGPYEREAIRPHIFGKFSDMLLSVVQHPAMLLYLDNQGSIGPNSPAGRRRDKGLNENLAREILELHTLGVNGGYTQSDVISLAKIITGWTLKPPQLPGNEGFRYIDRMHEPGAHTLLGKTYAQKGVQQGIQALKDLAMHPSTARFLATKLATHFVSDKPPQRAIDALERSYMLSGGDLGAVSNTLIDLQDVWKDPLTKFKTPYEMVVSSFRLLGLNEKITEFDKVFQTLVLLDQAPFTANSPAGWDDHEKSWMSSNALMNRIEWVHAVAQKIPVRGNPNDLAKITIGPVANPDTLLWISRAPDAKDALALLMASPEFQRR